MDRKTLKEEKAHELQEINAPPLLTPNMAMFLALVTVGTALGYMFLSSKIRNISNVKIPGMNASYPSNWFSKGTTSTKGPRQNTGGDKVNEKDPFEDYQRKVKEDLDELQRLVMKQYENDLKELGLNDKQFQMSEVKKAYRDLVKQYHPDLIPQGDPRKDTYKHRFQSISNSYQRLSKALEKS